MEYYELEHAAIVGMIALGGGLLILWRLRMKLAPGLSFVAFLRRLDRPLW